MPAETSVLVLLAPITMNYRRLPADGTLATVTFGDRTLLAQVAAAARDAAGDDARLAVALPDGDTALADAARAAGLDGLPAATLDGALRGAATAAETTLLLVPLTALFLDIELTRLLLQRHRAAGAALTLMTALPHGLTPQVFDLPALRRLLAEEDGSDGRPLTARLRAGAERYPHVDVPYEGDIPVTERNLCFVHHAQTAAYRALWEAAGGRGAAAVLEHAARLAGELNCFPHWLQVELTPACNHACGFCPHTRRGMETPMSDAVFARLIDGLRWRCDHAGIDLAGFGEPTLHPRWQDYVQQAVDADLEVFLYTNGTQWTEAHSAWALDRARQSRGGGLKGIVFSINAATAAQYRAVHGADDLARVRAALRGLLQAKKAAGTRLPVVAVQYVKSRSTDSELEAWWQEWNFGERFERQRWPDYDHQAAQGELRLRTMELERAGDDAARAQQQALHAHQQERYWDAFYAHAELPLEHTVIQRCNDYAGQLPDTRVVDYTPLQRAACRQAPFGAYVLADGRVTACQQDFNGMQAFGTLADTGLVELWNSPAATALRRDQAAGRYSTNPLCAVCRDWFIPMI